ncbi:hypothetical protein I4U23_017564 [Adineta vaga]|nr:hypothetical protein I4U23_017564 [Adineta vaga]
MDTGIINYYRQIQNQLYIISGIILLSVGIIGNLMNCIVFAQKPLRQNPSSIYFIAISLVNLCILFIIVLPLVILNISDFDYMLNNIARCKIAYYFTTIFVMLSRYYLILVAIDRVIVTSSNVLIRQRSTQRLAYWSIAGVTCVILLCHTHLLVKIDIVQLNLSYYVCYTNSNVYMTVISYSNLVIGFLIPLFLSIVLTTMTLKNIREVRVRPTNAAYIIRNNHRSKDRQFTLMGLSEIAFYVVFNSPTAIRNIYQQITLFQTRNSREQAFEQLLQHIFYILIFILPAINCYIYLIVSKAFRKKILELFYKCWNVLLL